MIIVRGASELSDGINPTKINFEYGDSADGLFSLEEFFEGDPDLHLYPLDGDQQYANKATHFAVVSTGKEKNIGRLFLMDNIIDGPFFLMLAQGNKLKGFHCHDCAEGFVKWFTVNQSYWRDTYHVSSTKDQTKKSVH